MNASKIMIATTASVAVVLLAVPPALAGRVGQGYKKPAEAVQLPLLEEPPELTAKQLRRLQEACVDTNLPVPVRVNPDVDPESIRPKTPETVIGLAPLRGTKVGGGSPCDFTIYRNSALPALTTGPGCATTPCYAPATNEPSMGVHGRVVFYSGNWYAAVSGDAGQNFQFIDPADLFDASGGDGTPDPVNCGFCCDQIVYYERTRGVWFWLLQYGRDGNTNTQRLAVVTSPDNQTGVMNSTWRFMFYDWTPADFGFNATGFWLDFPDLSVSENFLFLTASVFQNNPTGPGCPQPACTSIPNGCPYTGSIVARFPLDALAQGQGFSYRYYQDNLGSFRCTQGATDIMWFAAHEDNTELRVWRWADSLDDPTSTNVAHGAYNPLAPGATPALRGVAPGPDGLDWAGFGDSRVLASWRADNRLGFMWGARQGGSFPFPYVYTVVLRESDRDLLSEGAIWSNSRGFLFPSVNINDRGDIAGTMAFGGGTFFPSTLAWIADDCNSDTIIPLENVVVATGQSGPPINRWGDYLTTRRHVPYGNTWAASAFALNLDLFGNIIVAPRYVWLGRQQDAPPANNTIRVDRGNASGWEDGSTAHPYNTFTEGDFAALNGDTVVIQAGNYPETGRFGRISTAVTVRSQGGTVTIGQ